MGAKTKDVGGGPATGLAKNYVDFLQGGLNTGTFGNTGNFGGAMQNIGNLGLQQTPTDNMARANPTGSTAGIGGVINKALGGGFAGQAYNPDVSGLQNLVGKSGYDFGTFNPATANFAGYNPQIAGNEQLQGFLGGLQKIGSYSPQDIAALVKNMGAGSLPGQAPNVTPGPVDISAYQNLWDRTRKMGQLDTRARYGASGGAAFGTPAAFAESNYLNENDAQRAAAMADIGRQQQGVNLQAAGINSQNYNAYLNAISQQNIAGMGLFGNLLGNQVSALQGGGNILSGALTNEAGLNLDALKALSQQGIDVQGLLNQYQGMAAQNKLGAAGLDANMLANILGYQGDAARLNEGQRQFDVGTQTGMTQDIMNQIAGLSQKGLSQRQTIQQPSTFQNVLGAAQGIAGVVAPFATGGFNPLSAFGGGGGSTPSWLGGGGMGVGAGTTASAGAPDYFGGGGMGVGAAPSSYGPPAPSFNYGGGVGGALNQNPFGQQGLNFGGIPNQQGPVGIPAMQQPPTGGLNPFSQPPLNFGGGVPNIGPGMQNGGLQQYQGGMLPTNFGAGYGNIPGGLPGMNIPTLPPQLLQLLQAQQGGGGYGGGGYMGGYYK